MVSYVMINCVEMSNGETGASVNIYWPSANAIASDVVSIAHRDAQIKVSEPLLFPDKINGKVFGVS